MKMWNLFKNKKQPINPGDYDWTFQFVHGGFVPNNALRKDKSHKAIVWLGGFKFKLINVRKGNEVTFFNPDETFEYKSSIKFNTVDSFGDVIIPTGFKLADGKYTLENHKPFPNLQYRVRNLI